MVVSSNYNLIPYPTHHYPIQAYISDNAAAYPDPGKESIERHNRFRQPHSDIMADTIYFNIPGSRYDVSRCLQYCDADQVGRLVDIYA
jgi:hypothetical protein